MWGKPEQIFPLKRFGVPQASVEKMATVFGISGVRNVLGAIKSAKFYVFGKGETAVTVCTDNIARYHSVFLSKRSRAVSVLLRLPFPPLSVNTC